MEVGWTGWEWFGTRYSITCLRNERERDKKWVEVSLLCHKMGGTEWVLV